LTAGEFSAKTAPINSLERTMLKIIIFAITLFSTLSTFAQAPCSSLWSLGFPERGRVENAGNCTPFSPSLVLLSSGQEMYFQDTAGENPLYKQYMEWAAEAFVYASLKYSSFASVPKIRMVFSDRANVEDGGGNITRAFSYVEFFQRGLEFCPIVLYPASTDLNKEFFQQMVAHEIYHCVQKVNFPDQVSAVVQGASEGQFWFEGIAQFMSNDVYPRNDFEYHPMFGRFDQHVPFFQQNNPYLSEFFFQGLFWHQGASSANVHNTQSHFGGSGATGQDDALNVPDISEAFHKTARNLSFQELNDSSGNLAQWRAEKQVFYIPETPTSSITISFMDFSTEPFEIVFPKRGKYHLTIHGIDGAKLSVRKTGSPTWQERFDSTITTECNTDRKLEGIYTRVSPDLSLNGVRIDILREDNDECPCVIENKPTDLCLFGTWNVDTNTVLDFMRRLTANAFDLTSVSGNVKLTFTPDGGHQWDYQNLIISGQTRGRRPSQINMYWNGVSNLTYSNVTTSSSAKVCTKTQGNNIQSRATMSARGQTFNIPVMNAPFSGEGELPYHCNASVFTYDINTGPAPLNWIFHRGSAP